MDDDWPSLEPELAEVAGLLAQHPPPAEPARPAFAAERRAAFIRRAAAHTEDPQPALARSGAMIARGSAHPSRPRAILTRWSLPLAAGVSLAVIALVALVLPRLPGAGPSLPPPIDRAELVARNARAWDALRTLTGAFSTGDGWYYEEWISRQPGGLRYKRYIRPPDRTPNRPQWNVSDGETEWVVDGASRRVRFSRPAVPGDFTAVAPNDDMQCTALALPAGMEAGSAPLPALVGGRPAYRLDGVLADGSPGTYWIDARDHLVFRIDRPGRGTVWRREQLELDAPLADGVFRPDSLGNL
jgi:hypothetical protein